LQTQSGIGKNPVLFYKMNKSNAATVSDLIDAIFQYEDSIKSQQTDLYALRDRLRSQLSTFNSMCFDNTIPDRPSVMVEVPKGDVYKITLSGVQYGLLIEQMTVVEVA
jgi:hypothetical protein